MISVGPPSRFSHYFTSVHVHSSCEKPKQSKDPDEPDDINDDFTRVEMKKKLLTLELANAGTQTEPRFKSQSTSSQTSSSLSQSTPNNKVDGHVSEPKQDELVCPSPIPKHDNETFKRNRRCKRKQSRAGKALVVTVVNNKTKISTNGTDTDSSNSYVAQSSIEHDKISVENGRTAKSVNIIVNVLSNATNIDRLAHKSREVARIIDDANLEKTSHWRRLFNNEEKLTESSYFSPPEAVSTHKRAETENPKPPKDIDYYIRKLLLMSPESVENLNVSSCNSTQVQETEKNTEHKKKIPVSIPLYQNSFEDTMNILFDVSSDRNNSTLMKDHSLRTDESDNSSTSVYLPNYTSSLSDSSIQEPEIVGKTIDEIPLNFEENENVRHESTVDDSEEENVELPSLDELLRRGFTWKPVLKAKMDDEIETLEEDEFIKEMLKVNIQSDDKNVEENECPKSSDDQDVTLSKAKNLLLSKNESRLIGWIGTTVQRTLEASAMNSTSSGEGSDPFRKMHKTLENLVEEQQSLTPSNDNFSISPIKVPDIHLDVPTTFEKNTTKE